MLLGGTEEAANVRSMTTTGNEIVNLDTVSDNLLNLSRTLSHSF